MNPFPLRMVQKLLPAVALTACLLAASGGAALAADAVVVPKVIKLVVPYAPAASTDLLARQLALALSKRLGNTIIVDNKPGGGSVLGTVIVANAPPDGATLLLTSSAFTITPALQDKPPYDPVNDFAPIAILTQVPMILAVPASSSYRTPADFVNAARAQPGVLNYGSSGIGSTNHLAMELFKGAAKVQITHIPYKGMAPAGVDLSTGQVQAIIGSYSSLAPLMQGGKVRALGISSTKPSPFFPDLPALGATVPGYSMAGWFGVFAPRGTPPALVQLLNKEIVATINSDEFGKIFAQDRAEPAELSVGAFSELVRAETGQWKKIAAEQSIRAQ